VTRLFPWQFILSLARKIYVEVRRMFQLLTKRQRAGAVQDASRIRKSFKCPTGLGVRRPSAAFSGDITVSVLTENGSQKLGTPYVISYKFLETLLELRECKEFTLARLNFSKALFENFFMPRRRFQFVRFDGHRTPEKFHRLQPLGETHALDFQGFNHGFKVPL